VTQGERRDSFGCIILAAGAGTRFGRPKATATLPSGERFLDVVVRVAANSGAAPIVAVVPVDVQAPAPAQVVVSGDGRAEQISSVRLALPKLLNSAATGVLLWPVDHPFVALESVLAVLDGFRRTRAPIVIPAFEGRRGHPGLFARESWLGLMTVENGGARAVIHGYGSRVLEVPVPDAGVIRDIDKLGDIAQNDRRPPDAHP